MNRKLTIAIDIDGVLTNGFVEQMEQELGTPQNPSAYNLKVRYPDADPAAVDLFLRSNRVYFDCQPEPDAAQVMALLYEQFSVAVVTSRPLGSRSTTLDWLNRHGFKFHNFQVSTVDKPDLLYAIHADAIIEDDPYTLSKCEFLGVRPIVFDRPWNKTVDKFSEQPDAKPVRLQLPRIFNWGESYGKILDVINGRPAPEKAKK